MQCRILLAFRTIYVHTYICIGYMRTNINFPLPSLVLHCESNFPRETKERLPVGVGHTHVYSLIKTCKIPSFTLFQNYTASRHLSMADSHPFPTLWTSSISFCRALFFLLHTIHFPTYSHVHLTHVHLTSYFLTSLPCLLLLQLTGSIDITIFMALLSILPMLL